LKALLQVRNLSVSYFLGDTRIVGIENVDLEVGEREILGVVGESGSGKSTLATTILRALKLPGKVTSGSIFLHGQEILNLNDDALRKIRWEEISLVPQASQNALSPTMRVRDHFKGVMRAHGVRDDNVIRETSTRYLKEVMLEPLRVMNAYPHELSGGMKQRVLIALCLVLEPKLIILDEPTSALDLITQETILNLVKSIHDKTGVSMLFITHDISLVSDFADRTAVMYHGKVMEVGPTREILGSPINPYTRALLRAIPKLHGDMGSVRPIVGSPPSPTESLPGCPFHPRCAFAEKICGERSPFLESVGQDHVSACHFNGRMINQQGLENVS
jgi:peptide/nickel transport system ATP-binding protein